MESHATAKGKQEQPSSSVLCAIRAQLTDRSVLIGPFGAWALWMLLHSVRAVGSNQWPWLSRPLWQPQFLHKHGLLECSCWTLGCCTRDEFSHSGSLPSSRQQTLNTSSATCGTVSLRDARGRFFSTKSSIVHSLITFLVGLSTLSHFELHVTGPGNP